jgi:hypothetical protein
VSKQPPKEQIRRRNRGPDVGDVLIAENLAHPLLGGILRPTAAVVVLAGAGS